MKIFLSASVPDQQNQHIGFGSGNTEAIRDAVRALARVVIPSGILVWGGHPSITPLIRYVMLKMKATVHHRSILYQSAYFLDEFGHSKDFIGTSVVVPQSIDRENSLLNMRCEMLKNHSFDAGIFIGGMEGVKQEFTLFRQLHPNAIVIPVASTGAAAHVIYSNLVPKPGSSLSDSYSYLPLFKSLLNSNI